MANRGYVDIDLYGRAFDGIFGPGAEEANRRQALMKFQAMKRFKERVKPGEYIDLDLYGRGDPRIFGHQSHIHTQREAQKHLEEAQRRKKERKVNHLAVVFPPGIKAITRFAKELIQRRSSSTIEQEDIQEDDHGVEDDNSTEDQVAQSVEHDPERDVQNTTETETRESLEEDSIQAVDRTPKRLKSKLPSEEVRPHVEKGHVLRAIKSFSSFDKVDNRTNVPGNVILAELARVQKCSSLPVRGILLPVQSDAGSNSQIQKELQVHAATHGSHGASITEDEVAKGILDGDDEEFQLSFSAPPQPAVQHASNDTPSTTSEEDLFTKATQLEHTILNDEEGGSIVGTNKIKDLFRSGDMESSSGPEHNANAADDLRDPGHDSSVPGEAKGTPQIPSSTEDEELTEHAVPVTGLSFDDIHIPEDASHSAVEPVAEENNDIDISSRGDSIIKLVETPDISFNDHSQHIIDDNSDEAHYEVEEKGVSTPVAHVADNAIAESNEHNAETVVDEGTSSSGTSSSRTEDEDNEPFVENAGNELHSESAQDSDRSAEADSSSEVISSSPEEDSGEVDADSSEMGPAAELVEDIVEVNEIEEAEAAEYEEREISDSATAELSDQDAGNELHSESAQDSDHPAEADSSSEVISSSPEEEIDDVDRDSSKTGTAVELVEDIVEVDGVEETEAAEHEEREISDSVAAESSSDQHVDSEDDAGVDVVERDHSVDGDNAGDDEINDADDTARDEAEKRTFWQRLGLFGAVINSSSRMVF